MTRTAQDRTPARRGPKATFSRQDVIDVGLRQGVAVLTLSSVAKELGVSHTALYREFAGTDELRSACASSAVVLILDQLGEPVGETWQDVGIEIARILWEALERYPGLALTLVAQGGGDLDDHPSVVRVTRVMTRRGLSYARSWVVLDLMLRTAIAARAQSEAVMSTGGPLPDSFPEYREALALTGEDADFWASPVSYQVWARILVDGLSVAWGA